MKSLLLQITCTFGSEIYFDMDIMAQVFLDLDFTLMEMNPFTLDAEGKPFPLDMRGELDDTAAFKSGKKCAARPLLHFSVQSCSFTLGACMHTDTATKEALTGTSQA